MKVVARVPFDYGDRHLDRGEIFETRGYRNDTKLLGFRYMLEFDPEQHVEKMCDTCGRKFALVGALEGHRRKPNCFADTQRISDREGGTLINKAEMVDENAERA